MFIKTLAVKNTMWNVQWACAALPEQLQAVYTVRIGTDDNVAHTQCGFTMAISAKGFGNAAAGN